MIALAVGREPSGVECYPNYIRAISPKHVARGLELLKSGEGRGDALDVDVASQGRQRDNIDDILMKDWRAVWRSAIH